MYKCARNQERVIMVVKGKMVSLLVVGMVSGFFEKSEGLLWLHMDFQYKEHPI